MTAITSRQILRLGYWGKVVNGCKQIAQRQCHGLPLTSTVNVDGTISWAKKVHTSAVNRNIEERRPEHDYDYNKIRKKMNERVDNIDSKVEAHRFKRYTILGSCLITFIFGHVITTMFVLDRRKALNNLNEEEDVEN